MADPMKEPVTNADSSWCVSRFRELTKHLIERDQDAERPATLRDFQIGFDAVLTVIDEYFDRRWPLREGVQ